MTAGIVETAGTKKQQIHKGFRSNFCLQALD